MKGKLIKCSIAALAAAFAAGVGAENISANTKPSVSKSVQLTDDELDAVTAGSAMSLVIVFNRAGKLDPVGVGNEEHHLTLFAPTDSKTFTFHRVVNRAHPAGELRCHGHCPPGY